MTLVLLQWNHRIPVCSRHGNPVITTAKARFRSRPPGWLGAAIALAIGVTAAPVLFPPVRLDIDRGPELYLLALGAVVFVSWIAHNLALKIVEAPQWGFCSRCRARRNGLALTAAACLALVFVSICLYVPVVLPEQLGDEEIPTLFEVIRWTVLFAPLVFSVAAAALLSYARWAVIARAVARRDGASLEFRRPAPEFVRLATSPVGQDQG
jgi:hypothetical protein